LAQTQGPAYSDPAGGQFIVRLQRIRSDRDVCAIVRRDGLFHLESETHNRVDASEGTLDDSELAELKDVLNNEDLAKLSQQKIAIPLLMTEKDELRVSILRSPSTQNLTFLDRESRRPFDDFIHPLLHWMDILQHHAHTTLGEFEGRNNCLPPKELGFTPRPAVQPSPAPASKEESLSGSSSASAPMISPKDTFLMRWEINHIAQGTVQDTCVIVYPSGQYRMEKTTQAYTEKFKLHAFEGVLDGTELRELGTLLNQPELRASTHRNLPQGEIFREGELTTLSVFREDRVQQLSFASYFGVPGWVSNVSAGTDPEERLVKPLRKWLKEHVEGIKAPALQNAEQTRCIARLGATRP
jgi:hypothetical protein